jgi:copper homeostasis protein
VQSRQRASLGPAKVSFRNHRRIRTIIIDSNQSRLLLEVCVASLADVAAATSAGADRVELCSSLELGGLTPSIGAVENIVEKSPVPVVAMVRPRAGGFSYADHEFAAMLRDTERFLNAGAAGVAFGILDRSGSIDARRSRELVNIIAPRDAVFHRAFDFVADWRRDLKTLIDIGCTRVLTSGGQQTAALGCARLQEMIDVAAGQIEIMPGGGIRAENAAEIVRRTRCRQLHIGAATAVDDGSLSEAIGLELCDFRFIGGAKYRSVDGAVVAATLSALRTAHSTQRP